MSSVLMDTKYHEENLILVKDDVLIQMYNEMPIGCDINAIPFRQINNEYKRRGGKHEILTIGSLKRALETLRLSDVRI